GRLTGGRGGLRPGRDPADLAAGDDRGGAPDRRGRAVGRAGRGRLGAGMAGRQPILDRTDPAADHRDSAFLRSHAHRAITQDLRWGLVKSEWGQEAVYLEEDGRIVAAMTLLVRRLPGGFSVLYAPRGPLVDWGDRDMVLRILDEARPLVARHRAVLTRFDPEVRFDEDLDRWLRSQPGWVVKNVGAGKDDII